MTATVPSFSLWVYSLILFLYIYYCGLIDYTFIFFFIVPVWFMDFILGWVENNNSVLVYDIHHIVALFCSYLPETYSSSLTYSQARWSKRETWLWLVYLFHWFVPCFALPFSVLGVLPCCTSGCASLSERDQVMSSQDIARECWGWIKLLQVVWVCT